METAELNILETSFNKLVETLLIKKAASEYFTVKLNSERSLFTRFNRARVRQSGYVADGSIQLTLMQNQRSSYRQVPFTGNWEIDWQQLSVALEELRIELPDLPIDSYLVLPSGNSSSYEVTEGKIPDPQLITSIILEPISQLDFTGIYAGGLVIQAYADSCGQKHWFATNTFTLDYSIFNPDSQAVKGCFAGSEWNQEAYTAKIQDGKNQLKLLEKTPKKLAKGQYRTYFAPAAVSDLSSMLSWGGISEADIQQGNSSLAALQRQEKQLSSQFNLQENFQLGFVPRFNELGEIAAPQFPLIEKGTLVNTLINSRTAKEYKKNANGANSRESLRALEISRGKLELNQILRTLETGLYVSNLHYLNWSDLPTGRITGMTRYACFWVENGEIVAPIENMRFDETLYRFWGNELVDFTNFQEFIPEVGTYEARQLGGTMVPGMLVNDFTYTL
jgi:predicted Zn-dependent protease